MAIHDLPVVAAADALARALARRQLLLVLDNCEQVIGAAAEVCGRLLLGADDVRVLATSREPLRIAGEVRYRLGPLTLPAPENPDDQANPEAAQESEAVTLFADRARRVDPAFALDTNTGPTVAQLVARLDGMPLAIELAAARVDALGVAQLLDRIDDRFELLVDGDRLAEQRQRSLAAAVQWSLQLLDDSGRRVFCAVSVFPGPFTLDGAEAVAGPDARQAVPRLVDCSLLIPPRVGPDGRTRYAMLETLRAYGAGLLAQFDQDGEVTAALVEYAAEVAEEASAGLYTRTQEAASLRHLDAEDVTLRHALAWAMEHDPPTALRLALSQAPMWTIRGRLISQAPLLAAAAEHADVGSDEWCGARMLLGQAAMSRADPMAALQHYTEALVAVEDPGRPESWPGSGPVLRALCLGGRSSALLQAGRVAEAADDARRALAVAREIGSQGLEAVGLACLAIASWQAGDRDGALRLVRQAQAIPDEFAGGLDRGLSGFVTMALIEAGDLAGAEQVCAAIRPRAGELGDLANLRAASCGTGRSWTCGPAAPTARRRICASTSRSPRRPGCILSCWPWCGQLRPRVRGHRAPGRGGHGVGGGVRAQRTRPLPHLAPEHGRARETPAESPAAARAARYRAAREARCGRRAWPPPPSTPSCSPWPAAAPGSFAAAAATAAGPSPAHAEPPGTRADHPGRPGPHRRADRGPAVHHGAHGQLAPGPGPGQDRLPPPRRPHPAGPHRRPGLTRPGRVGIPPLPRTGPAG